MCALAPLNLLVVLGAHLPEAFGEVRPAEESAEKFPEVAVDIDASAALPADISAEGPLRPAPQPSRRRRAHGGNGSAAAAASCVALGQGGGSTSSTAPAASSSASPRQGRPTGEPFPQAWPQDLMKLQLGSLPAEAFSEYVCEQLCFQRYPEWRAAEQRAATPRDPASLNSDASRSPPDPVDGGDLDASAADEHLADALENDARAETTRKHHFTLVLSADNVAALLVILMLSFLGAIYLWKICTRKSCTCRLCRNQYRTLNLLGSGGYGSVYLVERLGDGTRFVSKKILVREITEVDEYSREAKDLVTLRHRHIVSYEDDFVHVEYGSLEPKTFFIIIMEYCPEGDLKEKIESDFLGFTEDWVRTVFAQLLQAVQYLHSKNVIHRDLKSQNVFLMNDGLIRLGDFGLCRHTQNRALGSATLTHAGTDCYMAPEMLSSSKYGKPADMWSMGCVLYELCTGQFMWELDGILGAMVMKDSNALAKLLQSNLVPAVGGALCALMKRLLSVKPAVRPTATTCIRKKIFKRGFNMSRQTFGSSLGETEFGDEVEATPEGLPEADDASSSFAGTTEGEDDAEESKNSEAPRRKRQRRRRGSKARR